MVTQVLQRGLVHAKVDRALVLVHRNPTIPARLHQRVHPRRSLRPLTEFLVDLPDDTAMQFFGGS